MPTRTQQAFSLWVLMLQTRDAVYNVRNKELTEFEITQREAAILHAVSSLGEKATPAEISRWTYRKPHTISQLVERMNKKGLVKKLKDLEYKNFVHIVLTEKGETAYDKSLQRKSIGRVFRNLSNEERLLLSYCLTKIRDTALADIGESIHRPFP